MLSIITVCLNEAHVERTCESIVNQTFQDFEWIVIDGGSNTETLAILKKYNWRMNYFISEPDAGIYDAMNKGIVQATGEWLNFMNAGDTFFGFDIVSTIFNNMEAYNNMDVLYGNLIFHDADTIKKMVNFPEFVDIPFFHKFSLGHPSSFIKRNTFFKYGLYATDYKIVSDYRHFLLLALKGCCFKKVPYIVSEHYVGGISTTHKSLELKEREIVWNTLHTEDQLKEGNL